MAQPPAGRPPANRPSTVRPAGAPAPAPPSQRVARPAAPAPAPPSQRVPAAPARPAASPPSQRVAAVPPAPARPAPASQKIPLPAAKPSPGTQRISKAPAPQPEPPGEAPSGPPSSRARMQRPGGGAPVPVPAAERKPLGKGRLIFNLSIFLSIPVCIAIIAYGVWKKGVKGVAKGIKDKATDVGKQPENVGPQVTDEQKKFDEIQEKYVKVAETKFQIAELKDTPEEKKLELWKEVVALDEEYIQVMTPILEDPRYKGEGFGWMSKNVDVAMQRLRLLRDRIRAAGPKEEEKPPEPNTRALGAIAGWNGTAQKLAIIFFPKDASPADPAAAASDFGGTIGRTGSELKDLPAERAWELIKGTVKEDIEKLDADAKKGKCEELSKGVQVFEATKFPADFGYLKQLSGYYYKDQFARAKVQIHDDRGVSAFKEYWALTTQAIGTPVKGWENVSAGLCEWRMTWKKEGVVYRLNAIGTKNGMDLTFAAYNETNWKALAEERGDKDIFEEDKQEDWADRTPKEPPQ